MNARGFRDRRILERADNDRLLLERGHLRALVQHERHHQEREPEIHDRAHHEHLEALPLRLGEELVGRAASRVFGILARHLDVTAKRDGADAVFRVAARERQQLRAEPERKRQHAHADPARREEMPKLVDENEHAKNEDKRKNAGQIEGP